MRLHTKASSRGSSAAKDMSPLRDLPSRKSSLARAAKLRDKDARDTLVRKPRRSKDEAQRAAQLEEVDKLKSFIAQMEAALVEVKELVQKKEKSISSRSSGHSAKTEPSKGRGCPEPRQRVGRLAQRRNLFFGPQESSRADRVQQRNTAPATSLSGKLQAAQGSLAQKPPQGFKQYIRDCFVNKIKDRQIDLQLLARKPSLPRPAVAEKKHAASSQDLPVKQPSEDTIEFLTPSHSSTLKPRAACLLPDSNSGRLDSLAYTVSKSKQRQLVSNFRPQRGAASKREISGFD